MNDLQIASPQGFSAPRILQLDKGAVQVSYGQLRSDPVHITSLTLRKPSIVVEQANGKFNFQAVMDQMPKSDPNAKPIKVIIDNLKIEDATVILHPGLPGLSQELKVTVPTLEMHDVGSGEGNKNGAAIKDVAVLVITALAQKGGDMSNIDALKGQLSAAAKNVEHVFPRVRLARVFLMAREQQARKIQKAHGAGRNNFLIVAVLVCFNVPLHGFTFSRRK